MSANNRNKLYFSNVAALPDNSAVICGHLVCEGSEPTATLVVHYKNGKWKLIAKVADVVNQIIYKGSIKEGNVVCVLGRNGYIAEYLVENRELISENIVPARGIGYLEAITYKNNAYYIAGSDHEIIKYADNSFYHYDDYLSPTPLHEKKYLSIACGEEIYCCGTQGSVIVGDGVSWNSIESPTNIDLNVVFCTKNGHVYFASGGGLLWRYSNHDGWTEYECDDNVIFWNVTEFHDELYLAAGTSIYKFNGSEIVKIQMPPDYDCEIYSMSSSLESIWLVGDEYLHQFDGEKWTKHVSPTNE
ncbi:MAG: hypothetical protein ABW096_00785 [Candidatus Thiodiazotropha sp.]